MKTKYYFLALAFISLLFSCKNEEENTFQFDIPEEKEAQTTTYYFLRHAEKDTLDPNDKDPQLTEEGIKRANYLAKVYFADKELDLFYSTDFSRTIQTLIPTVHYYKGDILSYDGGKDSLFTKKFWQDTYGKNVVVVGHSNTSPRFVNEILAENKYEKLDESTYDVFFKVEVDENLNVKDYIITRIVPENFSYN
ncbi:histidine phosphatase family protein [Psychroflexus sp. CAK8W]|uniref:Histidine phosphatase family protein n=1 Tax=Psychroflexus longus TaxID=2873596 RepID=A0ABS7XI84_9FLAO|nr:phosphoglycerate mutase family protein [Psychroflexus longus]MBZ9778129.1 histidine phosphatase family protein [Psychroflexus longus]